MKDGVLSWKQSEIRGALTISHSTPFSPWRRESGLSDRDKYIAAQLGLKHPEYMPMQLDIWHNGKVLNVEWDNSGGLIVVGYKPGAWESLLDAIATTTQPQYSNCSST